MLNFLKGKQLEIAAPLTGKVIPVTEVPDPVFAEKVLGDGIAVDPTEGTVYSPVDGTIFQIAHTFHAMGIESDDGLEILVHLGIVAADDRQAHAAHAQSGQLQILKVPVDHCNHSSFRNSGCGAPQPYKALLPSAPGWKEPPSALRRPLLPREYHLECTPSQEESGKNPNKDRCRSHGPEIAGGDPQQGGQQDDGDGMQLPVGQERHQDKDGEGACQGIAGQRL